MGWEGVNGIGEWICIIRIRSNDILLRGIQDDTQQKCWNGQPSMAYQRWPVQAEDEVMDTTAAAAGDHRSDACVANR